MTTTRALKYGLYSTLLATLTYAAAALAGSAAG